ncbi:gluzincin family metallopeptidase [Flavobacterium cellulosilyticum]|uniref:aminopeptidase n=1 Tax=Flavobacterium cellulosilyticum TaxID=2541731 RepID=UPI001FE5DCD0|nr:aminopeptidase [Flavobacterium cellulosilyticum]
MKSFQKIIFIFLLVFTSLKQYGQHNSHIVAEVNTVNNKLNVQQELVFYNQSEDTLTSIVLNDWMNAYSSKTSPLAKRFSDEFYRGFHLANEEERGGTINLEISAHNQSVFWERAAKNPDLILVKLGAKLAPKEKITLHLTYIVKVPSDKFTHYGHFGNEGMYLKNWFIIPARYENFSFIKYSNNNLDDIANGFSNFDIELIIPNKFSLTTDLKSRAINQNENTTTYTISGTNRTDFSVFLEPKNSFHSYKNNIVEVLTNLNGNTADEIQKAIAVDRVVRFTNNLIGKIPYDKITVSQADYDRNPFYGLNQLPSFIVPFPDEFLFEIKFLKTYLNNYLKNTLKLDPRKDNWIYDGIQIYTMMKYMEENCPDCKMTGRIADYKIFKSFNILNLDFNEQYSYFYLLMARKNLDQPLGTPKNQLIKFNEQIASKYRAGLSLIYLDNYLGNDILSNSIKQFIAKNENSQTTRSDFETLLKSNAKKNIDWFFNTIINSREIIDYKFKNVSKTKDSVSFSLKNKTLVSVPMPIYGIKNDSIVFKKWIETNQKDSIYTIARNDASKIVINYKNEVPEFNLRNNWVKLDGLFPNNRPVTFAFMKDLENPYYNQVLYAPILTYNVYDGMSPGIRLQNKAILNKPFIYDITPTYALKSHSISGGATFIVNRDFRNSNLFNIRYSLSSSYFHYAPDATYFKLNPMVLVQIRNDNYRDNRKQLIVARQVIVNRQKSEFVIDNSAQNYSVFNLKYINSRTEVTDHIKFVSDVQFSSKFGKVSSEIQFRKLFEDNRQINLRLFAASFIYNRTNSDFYSFGLDRPKDYLFDYPFLGRSSSTGIVSQEFIMAEGGFKSKLNTRYANQWISTLNASYSLWNWIDVYGDFGLVNNKNQNTNVVYDSGIRLNLLEDFFELYFPVYSNNGLEISQTKYNEKIRFIITLDPNRLLQLFTRKWF